MNLAARILKLTGWKLDITVPDYPKCIICVAPHTSNWDFILGKLAYAAVGRKAGFLMKASWFVWPLGYLFRAMGGVPVSRGKGGGSLVESLVERFNDSASLQIAITPEGTRSRTDRWHTGFLRIALDANIPIVLGAIDFTERLITITHTFTPSGDIESDMRVIKDYYRPFRGKYPDKFSCQ